MSNPVLQIMLRKYAGDYKADGVVADAMRDAADEIDRLNKWADGMTDAVLKERATSDALIKELQAKLSARPEALRSEWIPVRERLPKKHFRCLVAYKKRYRSGRINSPYEIFDARFSGGEWRFLHPQLKSRLSKRVTHWMPLPDAPRQKLCDDCGCEADCIEYGCSKTFPSPQLRSQEEK